MIAPIEIPDPLDLDAPDFTPEYRADIVAWAVKTTREALDPDCDAPGPPLGLFPFAVYILQFETALRAAEERLAEVRS